MTLRPFPAGFIGFPLRPFWRACVFLLAVAICGVFAAVTIMRIAIGSTLGNLAQPAQLRKALALDPANPQLHNRLGVLALYSLEGVNLNEGIEHLQRATELNPHRAVYWADLGIACDTQDSQKCSDQAMEHALKLSPMTPRLRWLAANHYLRTGQTDKAVEHFRRLLELDPGYALPSFHVCLGLLNDPQVVLQDVLPLGKNPKLKLAYIDFLSGSGQIDFAHRIWIEIVRSGAGSFPFSWTKPYLEHLMQLGRVEEVKGVWEDLERLGIIENRALHDGGNLVFNGDFEQLPLNAGLDWRLREQPYLSIDFLDTAPYHGQHCLRLEFTVSRNDEYLGVYQFVPVMPKQSYLLTAYTRSERISSDSGPRLRVIDPACPTCLDALSEVTLGTTAWHRVSLGFSTGPQTRLVQLSVLRLRSQAFPAEITGRFWLDDVSLQPAAEGSSKTSLQQ